MTSRTNATDGTNFDGRTNNIAISQQARQTSSKNMLPSLQFFEVLAENRQI
tara:strand:+ start:889 stop:1041 length:153 start_codon:yes stop_codon:yes gene_type:complete